MCDGCEDLHFSDLTMLYITIKSVDKLEHAEFETLMLRNNYCVCSKP